MDVEFLVDQTRLFTKSDASHELELRWKLNGIDKGAITEDIYQRIVDYYMLALDDTSLYRVETESYEQLSYEKQGDIPYRVKRIKQLVVGGIPQPNPLGNEIWSKQTLRKHDFNFLVFTLRLAESSETLTSLVRIPPGYKETFRRVIERTTFVHRDGIKIDCSKVINHMTDRESYTSYEVEIEYTNFPEGSCFEVMYPFIQTITSLLMNVSIPYYQCIQYASMETVFASLRTLLGQPFDTPAVGLAYNLKPHHVATLADYALTNKLDGERKFIYTTSTHLYVFQQYGLKSKGTKTDVFITLPHSIRDMPTMILDCEAYQGTYHMFDVMYYNDATTTIRPSDVVSHRERMSRVPVALVQSVLSFQKKIFYYDVNPLSMLIRDHTNPKTFFHENDGFIFTPKACRYHDTHDVKPNLKYKFSSKLSLDFFIDHESMVSAQHKDTYPFCYQLYSSEQHAKHWKFHLEQLMKSRHLSTFPQTLKGVPTNPGHPLWYAMYRFINEDPNKKNMYFSYLEEMYYMNESVRVTYVDTKRNKLLSLYPSLRPFIEYADASMVRFCVERLDTIHKEHPYGVLKSLVPLDNHSIAECIWHKQTWVLLRYRPDRLVGNRYSVIQDVMADMRAPIALTTLFTSVDTQSYLQRLDFYNVLFVYDHFATTQLSFMYHTDPTLLFSVLGHEFRMQHIDAWKKHAIGALLAPKFRDWPEDYTFLSILYQSHATVNTYVSTVPMYSMEELKSFHSFYASLFKHRDSYEKHVFDVRSYKLLTNNHLCVSKHGYAIPSKPTPLPSITPDMEAHVATLQKEFPSTIVSYHPAMAQLYKSLVYVPESNGFNYSSLKPWHALQLKDIYKSWFPYETDVTRILDTTANIGIDTIYFSTLFPEATIDAFELVPKYYLTLKRNVEANHLTSRIHVHYQDSTTYLPTKPVDLVYMDPPWGGSVPVVEQCRELYFQAEHEAPQPEKNMNYVVDQWMNTGYVRHIVIKVPTNANTSYLFQKYNIDLKPVYDKKDRSKDISYYLLHVQPMISFLSKPLSELTLWTVPYICDSYHVMFENTQVVLVRAPMRLDVDILIMNASYFMYSPFSYSKPKLIHVPDLYEQASQAGFTNISRVTLQNNVPYLCLAKPTLEVPESHALQNMKRYHNLEKKSLILEYCHDKRVLDLGAGYGGDLAKYNEAKVKELFLVEPLEENIVTLKSRLENINTDLKHITTLMYNKGQDQDAIVPRLSKPVDVVSSFFSLTFLFESKSILGAFLDTAVASLVEGGYFIGTMMSGEATYELLNDTPTGDNVAIGDEVVINKRYENGPPATGQQVTVRITDSILHGDQVEYLAYFSILREELERRKCRLITYFPFSSQESKLFDLSPNEIKFSRLNVGFVFQYLPDALPHPLSRVVIDDTYEFTNLYQEMQVLVRTGVPALHSFYHSYLYNTSSSYRQSPPEVRVALAIDLRKKHGPMTLETLPEFMKATGVNVYVMDGTTRRPLKIAGYDIRRPVSIVVVKLGEGFEPIAVRLHDTAYRAFPPIDPFLTRIHHARS